MATPKGPKPADPLALLRTRRYVALLVLAAILGVPISAIAYFFLKLVAVIQNAVFTTLPSGLGFHSEPLWWPLLPLALAGLLVGLTIRYLPGKGGHSPADGLHTGGTISVANLPGVFLAALATLSLGAVLGPEAPLIALGAGLAVLAVHFSRRDMPAQTIAVVGAAGSFAAIATLFGSPLPAAFLLMEAVGLGGAMLEIVLLPGLLAAGVGALIFVGLDAWTGFGAFSLAIPSPPSYSHPDLAQFGWALVLAPAAAVLGTAIRRIALAIRPHVERRLVLLTPLVGLAVAGLAIAFAAGTGKSSSEVLFSGQSALGPFISQASSYSVGALLLLLACKGLAYSASMSGFRGGPTFPAMFVGAVGGAAASHLPGLPLVPAVAIGIGAMAVAMLRLPLTSVLLATLLLGSDGLAVSPLVIVAVVIAYVITVRLTPPATQAPAAESAPAPRPRPQPNVADARGGAPDMTMTAPRSRPWRRLGRRFVEADSYGFVLLLVMVTYTVSVSITQTWAASIVLTVQVATVWFTLRVSQARQAVRRVADILLYLAAATAVVSFFVHQSDAERGGVFVVCSLLYLIAPFSIVRHLMLRRDIDIETLLGAVTAYLLIGMFFAFAYKAAGIFGSVPFYGAAGRGSLSQDLFFSFVTMTTVGYGDLVPAANPGQTLAVLEALIGQLFLVVAVGKVISSFQPRRRD